MREIVYVSWDPGQSTGVACWSETGDPLDVGTELKSDDARDRFLDRLESHPVREFIIEEYRVYGSKALAHTGSKVYTAQVIGDLKSWARRHGVKVIEQRSDIKEIAAKWAQVKVPKGHMPDWMAAYLHGYYYLHRKGLIKPKVLETLE